MSSSVVSMYTSERHGEREIEKIKQRERDRGQAASSEHGYAV